MQRFDFESGGASARLLLADGTPLFFRVARAKGVCKGLILWQHGAGMDSAPYVAVARVLAARGYDVFLMDTRGHGQSGGAQGDVGYIGQYQDDLGAVLDALADHAVPVFLVAHSGSAGVSVDLVAKTPDLPIAGFALMTPTFPDDPGLVRRSTGRSGWGEYFRYMLRFKPEPVVEAKGNAPTFTFKLGRFLLGKILGIGRGRGVLAYFSSPDAVPFVYTGRAVDASMIGKLDAPFARIAKPMFLAVGKNDAFVNSEAVMTTLPWLLPSAAPLTTHYDARGDHFSTLLLSVPKFVEWLDALAGPVADERAVA